MKGNNAVGRRPFSERQIVKLTQLFYSGTLYTQMQSTKNRVLFNEGGIANEVVLLLS